MYHSVEVCTVETELKVTQSALDAHAICKGLIVN